MEMSKDWTKRIIAILSVSVIANVLFIGILIGHGLRGGMPFPPRHHGGEGRLFAKEDFRKIDNKIKENEKGVEEALLKEPYDKKAVLMALEKFDEQMRAMRSEFHQKIADEAAKLPPNERLRLLPGRGPRPQDHD